MMITTTTTVTFDAFKEAEQLQRFVETCDESWDNGVAETTDTTITFKKT